MRRIYGIMAAPLLALIAGTAPAAAPATPGTVSVEPAAVEPGLKASVPAFVAAVGRALAARDFTLLDDGGHARFVADLRLSRAEAGTTTTKVPVSGASGVAGGSPSMVGGGLNVTLPTGKTRTAPIEQTRLEIRLRKRGEQDAMWTGTAITVRARSAADGKDDALATDLAEAIFRGYPEQAGSVISIP